jgi:hypothetical protein
MEQHYGKKRLQTLVDTYLTQNWLASNSKKCPSCGVVIEVIWSALSRLMPSAVIVYWVVHYQLKLYLKCAP